MQVSHYSKIKIEEIVQFLFFIFSMTHSFSVDGEVLQSRFLAYSILQDSGQKYARFLSKAYGHRDHYKIIFQRENFPLSDKD